MPPAVLFQRPPHWDLPTARSAARLLMNILIADDCPTTRRVLEKNLYEWGYQPMLAANGAEALQFARLPGAPRIILLDWLMPQLDGPAVCRAVRQADALLYTYII